MSFDCLNNFATLIQLISAVNFAYIFTRFHSRIYKVYFNEEKIIRENFTSFINEITVDMASLQMMEPIKTVKGASNEKNLNQLKDDYSILFDNWNRKQDVIKSSIHKVKNAKGIKSLFLFISLFCLVDLFLIAKITSLVDASGNKMGSYGCWEAFSIVFLFLSIIVPIILTCFVFSYKWADMTDVKCYKWTSWSFLLTVVISLLVSSLFLFFLPVWFDSFVRTEGVCAVSVVLSILLPFIACLISVVFIFHEERKVKNNATVITKDLRESQKSLHTKKIEMDKSYKMFDGLKPPEYR